MGFDPRGTAYYHAQLRREARISKRRGFSTLGVGKLDPLEEFSESCPCDLPPDSALKELDYELLSITDIVSSYFGQSTIKGLQQATYMLWIMLVKGFIINGLRKSLHFSLFTLYPISLVSLNLIAAIAGGYLITQVAPAQYGPVVGGLSGLIIFYLGSHILQWLESRLYTFYLLGDFLFSYRLISNKEHRVNERLKIFTQRILSVLAHCGKDEEVLIVGHSSGALLATLLAAKVIRGTKPELHNQLALLTMGSQTALSFFSDADKLREDIRTLGATRNFSWRDIFAPQDPISSGRFDPFVKLTLSRPTPCSYSLHSARFKEALSEQTYQRIKYNFFRIHMQYLKASETGKGFNYFMILENPLRLSRQKI